MSLKLIPFVLGPMENNTYLIADTISREAVIIDPGLDSHSVRQEMTASGWQPVAIWLTHAHFDHIAGINDFYDGTGPPISIGLHPDDLSLYRQGGEADLFGIHIGQMPEPDLIFSHEKILRFGSHEFIVRHTPGHTPGHVVFYSTELQAVCCGDLIFHHSIGRTDLRGGSHPTILRSIRENILTLPPNTHLLSGHGPGTTVAEEQANNPFLKI